MKGLITARTAGGTKFIGHLNLFDVPPKKPKPRIDITGQPVPYILYKRIPLVNYREYFVYKLPYGYGYFIRRLYFKAPDQDGSTFPAVASTTQTPELAFEFFDKTFNHARQVEPIPGGLLSTPGQADVLSNAAPAPVDANIFNQNFTATAPKNFKMLNLYYPNNDIIEIHITGQILSAAPPALLPAYVDILLQGYLVPDKTMILNRGL